MQQQQQQQQHVYFVPTSNSIGDDVLVLPQNNNPPNTNSVYSDLNRDNFERFLSDIPNPIASTNTSNPVVYRDFDSSEITHLDDPRLDFLDIGVVNDDPFNAPTSFHSPPPSINIEDNVYTRSYRNSLDTSPIVKPMSETAQSVGDHLVQSFIKDHIKQDCYNETRVDFTNQHTRDRIYPVPIHHETHDPSFIRPTLSSPSQTHCMNRAHSSARDVYVNPTYPTHNRDLYNNQQQQQYTQQQQHRHDDDDNIYKYTSTIPSTTLPPSPSLSNQTSRSYVAPFTSNNYQRQPQPHNVTTHESQTFYLDPLTTYRNYMRYCDPNTCANDDGVELGSSTQHQQSPHRLYQPQPRRDYGSQWIQDFHKTIFDTTSPSSSSIYDNDYTNTMNVSMSRKEFIPSNTFTTHSISFDDDHDDYNSNNIKTHQSAFIPTQYVQTAFVKRSNHSNSNNNNDDYDNKSIFLNPMDTLLHMLDVHHKQRRQKSHIYKEYVEENDKVSDNSSCSGVIIEEYHSENSQQDLVAEGVVSAHHHNDSDSDSDDNDDVHIESIDDSDEKVDEEKENKQQDSCIGGKRKEVVMEEKEIVIDPCQNTPYSITRGVKKQKLLCEEKNAQTQCDRNQHNTNVDDDDSDENMRGENSKKKKRKNSKSQIMKKINNGKCKTKPRRCTGKQKKRNQHLKNTKPIKDSMSSCHSESTIQSSSSPSHTVDQQQQQQHIVDSVVLDDKQRQEETIVVNVVRDDDKQQQQQEETIVTSLDVSPTTSEKSSHETKNLDTKGTIKVPQKQKRHINRRKKRRGTVQKHNQNVETLPIVDMVGKNAPHTHTLCVQQRPDALFERINYDITKRLYTLFSLLEEHSSKEVTKQVSTSNSSTVDKVSDVMEQIQLDSSTNQVDDVEEKSQQYSTQNEKDTQPQQQQQQQQSEKEGVACVWVRPQDLECAGLQFAPCRKHFSEMIQLRYNTGFHIFVHLNSHIKGWLQTLGDDVLNTLLLELKSPQATADEEEETTTESLSSLVKKRDIIVLQLKGPGNVRYRHSIPDYSFGSSSSGGSEKSLKSFAIAARPTNIQTHVQSLGSKLAEESETSDLHHDDENDDDENNDNNSTIIYNEGIQKLKKELKRQVHYLHTTIYRNPKCMWCVPTGVGALAHSLDIGYRIYQWSNVPPHMLETPLLRTLIERYNCPSEDILIALSSPLMIDRGMFPISCTMQYSAFVNPIWKRALAPYKSLLEQHAKEKGEEREDVVSYQTIRLVLDRFFNLLQYKQDELIVGLRNNTGTAAAIGKKYENFAQSISQLDQCVKLNPSHHTSMSTFSPMGIQMMMPPSMQYQNAAAATSSTIVPPPPSQFFVHPPHMQHQHQPGVEYPYASMYSMHNRKPIPAPYNPIAQ